MDLTDAHSELKAVLIDARDVAGGLLERMNDDGDVSPIEVVSALESLGLIDNRRATLLERFRSAATVGKRREKERSIRQFVLGALDKLRTPQTSGFREDYLYATELVTFKSRGVSALRRDEFSAWNRDHREDRLRVAYIVPCLDTNGRKVNHWMARSDWPLAARIVVPEAEHLWRVTRIAALVDAYRDAEPESGPLFTPLIDRYAREALGEEVFDSLAGHADRVEELDEHARQLIDVLHNQVASRQDEAAKRVEARDAEQQLWGVSTP